MAVELIGIKVFIASPSGLEKERKRFVELLDQYNKSDAIPRGFVFIPVGWEATLGGVGRPQSLINEMLIECDYEIVLMHNYWGTYPGINKFNATSGTEEEYYLGLECFASDTKAMKQLICCFKAIDPIEMVKPSIEVSKVLDFRKKIEIERALLYRTFSNEKEFDSIILSNLGDWLRKAENKTSSNQKVPIASNLHYVNPEELQQSREDKANELTISGWKYYKEFKFTEAEIEFSKAIMTKADRSSYLNYAKFLFNIGQLERSKNLIEEKLTSQLENINCHVEALDIVGQIFRIEGDFVKSEVSFLKALNLFSKNSEILSSGLKARIHGNLGNLYLSQEKFIEAKDQYIIALKLNKEIEDKKGIAASFGNLGLIAFTNSEFEEAENNYNLALKIFKEEGDQIGIANQYGNLGILYNSFGDLDKSEVLYKKALEIDKETNSHENQANQLGNLAKLFMDKGELDQALKYLKESMALEKDLNRTYKLAEDFTTLGLIQNKKGETKSAIESHLKALELFEKFNLKIDVANSLGNLAPLYQKTGKINEAIQFYSKALELNENLGKTDRQKGMVYQYKNLGLLLVKIGQPDTAKEHFLKGLEISLENKIFDEIEEITNILKGLKY